MCGCLSLIPVTIMIVYFRFNIVALLLGMCVLVIAAFISHD